MTPHSSLKTRLPSLSLWVYLRLRTRPRTPATLPSPSNPNGAVKFPAVWKPTAFAAAAIARTTLKPACLFRPRRTLRITAAQPRNWNSPTAPARALPNASSNAHSTAAQRKPQNDRVEINIQPELDFSSSPDDRAHPQTALVPVADLAERRRAGALDALFLALTYAGFLALFRSLGGQVVMEKVDAIVYLAAFYLFYAQYFFLFTTFAGATPGMQLRGITIVRLDGSLPDTRQLLWRSFGYLLSGATMMLGFLWSLWDEDHFTWQDRISQTYITAATPLMEMGAFEVHPTQRRFAHK